MKKLVRRLALLPVVLCLAGCRGDSAGAISRDYRNINNEVIDSLMMVTGESRAKFANEKILKTYNERVGAVDKRVEIWEQNREIADIVLDMLTSESTSTLFAENQINLKRLDLERKRIQRLLDMKKQEETDRRRQLGDPNPVVDSRKEWPNLHDLAGGGQLSSFKQNLENGGKLAGLFKKLVEQGKKNLPPNIKELRDAFDERRNNILKPDK
jgi:hypothetical protein